MKKKELHPKSHYFPMEQAGIVRKVKPRKRGKESYDTYKEKQPVKIEKTEKEKRTSLIAFVGVILVFVAPLVGFAVHTFLGGSTLGTPSFEANIAALVSLTTGFSLVWYGYKPKW